MYIELDITKVQDQATAIISMILPIFFTYIFCESPQDVVRCRTKSGQWHTTGDKLGNRQSYKETQKKLPPATVIENY